jgi:CRISPR/Cas system-associated exonuclease Cas4 (RecB family)
MIICSGNVFQDPITESQCIQCAKDNIITICGYGTQLLQSMFASQEDRSNEIHVTDITTCLLKAHYDKRNKTPEYVHHKLAKWLGISIHKAVENDSGEIPVSECGIIGKIDSIDGEDIIDFKTTRWLDPSKKVSEHYIMQLNVYRYLAKKKGRLFIQQIDLSGPTKCRVCKMTLQKIDREYRCPRCGATNRNAHLGAKMVEIPVIPEDEIKTYIEERVSVLKKSLDSGKEPIPEPGWICGYCPHLICPENPGA